MNTLFSLQHSFSCILDVPLLCVLLSHSVCSSPTVCAPLPQCVLLRLGGTVHMESPSDNTINDVHEHPEACDWVSKVEIGLISCRTSLNLVNGGTSLTTILGTRVLAALVGHLVGLWGCVLSPPGEPPLHPSMCTAEDLGSRPLSTMHSFCTRPYTALYVVTPWTVLGTAGGPPSLQLVPQCCSVTQVYRV